MIEISPQDWSYMKNKLQQFMQGRYGADALYRLQLIGAVVCSVLSVLTHDNVAVGSLFSAASMVLIWWAVFRALSRNIEKRYLENLYYLEWLGSVRRSIRFRKEKHQQRKDYKFFVCPNCSTNLRVPKGKGKVNITCSKCGTRFQGKT